MFGRLTAAGSSGLCLALLFSLVWFDPSRGGLTYADHVDQRSGPGLQELPVQIASRLAELLFSFFGLASMVTLLVMSFLHIRKVVLLKPARRLWPLVFFALFLSAALDGAGVLLIGERLATPAGGIVGRAVNVQVLEAVSVLVGGPPALASQSLPLWILWGSFALAFLASIFVERTAGRPVTTGTSSNTRSHSPSTESGHRPEPYLGDAPACFDNSDGLSESNLERFASDTSCLATLLPQPTRYASPWSLETLENNPAPAPRGPARLPFALERELKKLVQQEGLVIDPCDNDRVTIYRLYPQGGEVEDLFGRLLDLREKKGGWRQVIDRQLGAVEIEVAKQMRAPALSELLRSYGPSELPRLLLGLTRQGTPLELDLRDNPSLLILGDDCRRGSQFANDLALSPLFTHDNEDLALLVIDSAQAAGGLLSSSRHLLSDPLTAKEGAEVALGMLEQEVSQRLRYLARQGRHVMSDKDAPFLMIVMLLPEAWEERPDCLAIADLVTRFGGRCRLGLIAHARHPLEDESACANSFSGLMSFKTSHAYAEKLFEGADLAHLPSDRDAVIKSKGKHTRRLTTALLTSTERRRLERAIHFTGA